MIQKNKLREINLGKHYTEKTKKKISESSKGRKHSEISKLKISTSNKGKNKGRTSTFKGKCHTEEAKAKMSKAHKGKNNSRSKKVICLNNNKIFDSLSEAAQWSNLNSTSGITRVCCGIKKSAGKHPETGEKLTWRYYEEVINE